MGILMIIGIVVLMWLHVTNKWRPAIWVVLGLAGVSWYMGGFGLLIGRGVTALISWLIFEKSDIFKQVDKAKEVPQIEAPIDVEVIDVTEDNHE